MNKRFNSLLERHDSHLVESEHTQALKIFVDLTARPNDKHRRYKVYRNAMYLKTSPATIKDDLLKALKYLGIVVFEL